MSALRRAGNPLRVCAHQVASARGSASLDVLLTAAAKNVEEYHGGDSQKFGCSQQPKLSPFQSSFSSGWFMWNRSFSSQSGANFGDREDELEEKGFSDLWDRPEADKRDLELISEESSDEDAINAIDLPEAEADEKPEKEPVKKASQSHLLKIMSETPRRAISGALTKWVHEGNKFDRSDVSFVILNLRKKRAFPKALQLLEWIEETKHFVLEERDYASRLDLMAKVCGRYRAEKYIEDIPASHRGAHVYMTLLANYVAEANVRKAEQVFNKMKDLGFRITLFACNELLLLYKKKAKHKIKDVLRMMEKENVKPSLFTYKVLVDAKGAARDIAGMEKVVQIMQADGVQPDYTFQARIAKYYMIDGHREKAEAVLESMESDDIKEYRASCKLLLPLYASLGKTDDVERIWKICEPNPHLLECFSAVEAFGKLGNVERAEKVFEDMFMTWKSVPSRVYNILLKVYANQNLLDKCKNLERRMDEADRRIGISTADSLVKLYVDAGEVDKADSILQKLSYKYKMKPWYCSYLMLLDGYSKKGDVVNAEKVFSKLRQMIYNGRIKPYELLIHAYVRAKAPVYGFRERMKADSISPNNAIANLLAAADPSNEKKTLSELLA